jgi:hypothetical protein
MRLSANQWKINGQSITALGLNNVSWTRENQQAESLGWLDPLARFDSAPRWAYDTEIVLTCNDVVKLRARVRNDPSNLDPTNESINYRALGPWAWLDEMPYVQDFTVKPVAADPAFTEQRGDAILGQAGDGSKINVAAAIIEVVGSAIAAGCPITLGVLDGLDFYVPFERKSDLSHADAIQALLESAPTHVIWWDHSGLMPSINCGPRATLPAVDIVVRDVDVDDGGAYAPVQSAKINALYHLQASAVCLIFRREDVDNGAPTVKTFKQYTPADAQPTQPRALTRTWELAGSVRETKTNYITQPTSTQFISESLAFGGGVLIPSSPDFASVASFWMRKYPALKKTGVANILAFRKGARTKMAEADDDEPDAAFTPACERELLAGSITDWMQKRLNIVAEYQKITVEVLYKAPTDKPGVTEVKAELLTAIITATSAQTRIAQPYSMLDSIEESFTPAEEPPTGISARLYAALSELQHDGEFVLVDPSLEYDIGPGKVVNLITSKRPEWATMRALVQGSNVDCRGYANTVRVGYCHQLGIDDLKDMYRSNKTRQPVTTTRNYNPDGGAQQAGLAVYNPRNEISSTPIPTFAEKVEVTPGGAIATKEELVAAIKARYEALGILPLSGQWIDVTVAGKGKFRAIIVTSDSNLGGQWNASFQMTKDGVTIDYWVTMHQLGIY